MSTIEPTQEPIEQPKLGDLKVLAGQLSGIANVKQVSAQEVTEGLASSNPTDIAEGVLQATNLPANKASAKVLKNAMKNIMKNENEKKLGQDEGIEMNVRTDKSTKLFKNLFPKE